MASSGDEEKWPSGTEHLKERRDKMFIEKDAPTNTATIEDPYAFSSLGIDNSFEVSKFLKNFKIKIPKLAEGDNGGNVFMFDLIGCDAVIANTLRRIMISEIPTMAIERVNLYQNTSIIQDEVLVHRLGLIPIFADPREYEFRESRDKPHAKNTVVFTLNIKCEDISGMNENASVDVRYKNNKVYSKDLKWIPQANQNKVYRNRRVGTVHDDILIACLRPGQEIEAELFCEKGIGKTHAKWSPVATAFYRTHPEIEITDDILNEHAEEVKSRCASGVFDIEDLGNGSSRAFVKYPRRCTTCRECIRDTPYAEKIKLRRKKDHFIFTVESTGVYSAQEILEEALRVLKAKAQEMLAALHQLNDTELNDVDE